MSGVDQRGKKIIVVDRTERKGVEFKAVSKVINSKCESICKDAVDLGFIQGSILNCDYLVVNYFNRNIVGFACVIYMEDGEGVYIDLICNSDPETYMNIFNNNKTAFGGKHMIDVIKERSIGENKKYIKLSALTPVISYYSYLGFDFLIGKQNTRLTTNVKKLKEYFKLINILCTKNDILEKEIETLKNSKIRIVDKKLKIYEANSQIEVNNETIGRYQTEIDNLIVPITTMGLRGALKEENLKQTFDGYDDKKSKVKTEEVKSDGFPMIMDLPRSAAPSATTPAATPVAPSPGTMYCTIMGGTRHNRRRRRRRMTRRR